MHPGVYLFSIPYMTRSLRQGEDMYIDVKPIIDVELHVGRKQDIQEGKKITVLATSATIGFSNFVEDVFGNIRKCFFNRLFPQGIDDDAIRWIQIHPEAHQVHNWVEVHLTWDESKQMYPFIGTSWTDICAEDWFYRYYQGIFLHWH